MRHKASRELFGYWNRLRGSRPAPGRHEVEPSDIRHLLSDTFILEVSSGLRTISYRLAGTRLCATFGRELKGYGFLGNWNEQDCFEVTRLLARVYRDQEPVMIILRGHTDSGRHADFEMLLLPLEPMADGSARIIGIATVTRDHYWLGTEAITDCHLRSARIVDPASSEYAAESSRAPSLAPDLEGEPPALASGRRTSRRVAHLTVLDGGRDESLRG